MKCWRITWISVVLYCFPCGFGCGGITGKVNAIFRKETHDGCFGCVIIAGSCGKLRGIGRFWSRSSYVLVDIYDVKIDRDLVAPWQIVGRTIKSYDMIKLQCKCSARFPHKRRKRSSSSPRSVRRRHSDAVISLLGYRIGRSCIKTRALGS